jgi:predicted outer membrane protein
VREVSVSAVGFRSGWRRLWAAALVSGALLLLAPDRAQAAPDVPVPPENLLLDRGRGDISDADRDFVIKVRLAGLWEIPAGEMAQEKSDNARIKKIGQDIADQHGALDELTRNAAKKLRIELPDKPNKDQQTWLAEMRDAEGKDFDEIYIDRLRAAHGKIFPAIATIRSSTRNDTVRKLAQQANQFVMTHLTLLESSGLVDFVALPAAPPPAAGNGQTSAPAQVLSSAEQGPSGTANLPLVLGALAGGLAVGAFATRRFATGRRPAYRSRRPRYYGG